MSVNDNSIAVDPRLDFVDLGIQHKDWGLPATDRVRNPVNGGVFTEETHIARLSLTQGWEEKPVAGHRVLPKANIQYLMYVTLCCFMRNVWLMMVI